MLAIDKISKKHSSMVKDIFKFLCAVVHGGNLHRAMDAIRNTSRPGSKNSFLRCHSGLFFFALSFASIEERKFYHIAHGEHRE
jgi:hypothetical protein